MLFRSAAAAGFLALINAATAIGHDIQRLGRPDAPVPTPLFAVDQAEELFGPADYEESQRFLQLIARVLAPERQAEVPSITRLSTPPLFIWTIRADSLDALLHATDKSGLKAPQPFLLPPIPRDAYREIIEAPLAVAYQAGMRVSIDPLLVDTLVESSTGADALPLLAFTLRQLLAENRSGATAHLTLEQFQAAGGMGGILSKRLAAAERSAGSSPSDLRRLFIPNLTTWDEETNPPAAKRLVAEESRLLWGDRASLRSLADALVEARLLTRSGTEHGEAILEVAHEALLRLPPLSDWLAEDREFLVWRDRLSKARAAYEANVRGLLVGRELDIARAWLEARTDSEDIAKVDRAFVEASEAEDQRRRTEEEDKERRRQAAELEAAQERERATGVMAAASQRLARRTLAGLVTALLIAAAAAVFGYLAFQQKGEADTQRQLAQTTLNDAQLAQARYLVGSAKSDLGAGHATKAALVALEALPDKQAADAERRERAYWAPAEVVLDSALERLEKNSFSVDISEKF